MSSSVGLSQRAFSGLSSNGCKNCAKTHLLRLPCRMEIQSKTSLVKVEEEDSTKLWQISMPNNHVETLRKSSDLQFTKLQQFHEESNKDIISFGNFVSREATVDEEYWTAAWLRAESYWEDRPNERYADSYRRKYAEQEYNALKRRCKGYQGQTTSCIVTVTKEDKTVKCSVIRSVVGTLDLSIQYLLQGESFPGERIKAPQSCNLYKNQNRSYGYVSNLCVAKSSRRKGIAINMLKFAIETAKLKGAGQIFVHVHRQNETAQLLYHKLGFEIVHMASPQLVEEQTYLLCFQTLNNLHSNSLTMK